MIIIILDIGQLVQIILLCQTCLLFNVSYSLYDIECVSAWCLIVWFSDINVPRGRLGNLTNVFWELFSFKPRISSSFCIKTHWWFQCISLLLELYDPPVL